MLTQTTLDLLHYCHANKWAGYDPYDGLTSPLFTRLRLFQNRAARLVFIQLLKRSALNVRPLVGIRRGTNPKALALFASALVRLSRSRVAGDPALLRSVVELLLSRRTPSQMHAAWGYNFDWQNRTNLVPRYTPNVICTSFAGNALLDACDIWPEQSWFDAARSAGSFIMKGLNISGGGDGICFSYTPLDHGRVHNANLLAAAFLARLYARTGEQELLDHALAAARYSAGRQNPDGSWPYGEGATQAWIDNFHTGYNLTALRNFSRWTGSDEFEERVRRGFAFYRSHFFHDRCIPKYYHDRLYPVDIHSVAQSIITLVELRDLHPGNTELARQVCLWALGNMKHKDGFFFYQKQRWYTNRIPYMRWSQAWMLLALATLLEHGLPEDPAGNGRASETDHGLIRD